MNHRLCVGFQGGEVRALHAKMRQLGRRVPQEEIEAGIFGPGTAEAVVVLQETSGFAPTGEVDEATLAVIETSLAEREQRRNGAEEEFFVRGHLRNAEGVPIASATVLASDRELRHEERLGEALTDAAGGYEISYTADKFCRSEKGTADLIVRAFDAGGKPLASSDVLFNAPPRAQVELVVGGKAVTPPSEYESLANEIAPLLDGVTPADLTEDDIAFLASEAGLDRVKVSLYATAARLAKTSDIETQVFYGLGREGLPMDMAQLATRDCVSIRRALEQAVADAIVPSAIGTKLDRVMSALDALRVKQLLDAPPAAGASPLGTLIAKALPVRALQEKFVSHYAAHEGTNPELWQALRADPAFGPSVVADLQLTLQLGVVAQNHPQLVDQLLQMKKTGKLSSVRDLAKLDVSDWRRLVDATGVPAHVPGATADERATTYAAALAHTIEQAFPTAVVAARLQRDAAPGTAEIATFLGGNPDFDLGRSHVDGTLQAATAQALTGITNKAALAVGLKRLQRIFKVTPRYDEMQVLLTTGVDSARAIVRMGRSAFIARYGSTLGQDPASTVFDSADLAASVALAMFGKYSPSVNPLDLRVIRREP